MLRDACRKTVVDLGPVDDKRAFPAQVLDLLGQSGGLAFRSGVFDNHKFTRFGLGAERVAQTELPKFLRQVVTMAAWRRALVDPTLTEDWRIAVTVARAAGALLAIDLLG